MEMENVCRFIERQQMSEDVHVMHFVLETKEQHFDGWKTLSFYRMAYVLEGEGVYHTQHGQYRLRKGDIFFCLPAMLHAVQSIKEFR